MNRSRDVHVETSKKRRRMVIWYLILLMLLAIAVITTVIVIPIVLLQQTTTTSLSSTAPNTTKSTTTEMASTRTTITKVTSTTTTMVKVTSAETTTEVTSTEVTSTEATTETTSTATTVVKVASPETTTESTSPTTMVTKVTSAGTTTDVPLIEVTSTEVTSTEATTETTSTATTVIKVTSAETTAESTSAKRTTEVTSTEATTETISAATTVVQGISAETTTETTTETTIDNTISDQNISCVFPFMQTSSGECVNILIDFNNCGIIGYVCPANYTSCSNGLCSAVPTVQLTNPIPIFTAALNGSVDDTLNDVTVPFNITLYNTTTNFVQVTTNGVLCLGNCSNAFTETPLPAAEFSGPTALPYWDDLFIYANTSQGIYYQSNGNASNRTLTFEYYCSHYLQPSEYYHFQVVFFENNPGIVQYIYYDISDRGATCTVGVQGSSFDQFIQHSFDRVNSVINNMILTFDTNAGIYTNSSFI